MCLNIGTHLNKFKHTEDYVFTNTGTGIRLSVNLFKCTHIFINLRGRESRKEKKSLYMKIDLTSNE